MPSSTSLLNTGTPVSLVLVLTILQSEIKPFSTSITADLSLIWPTRVAGPYSSYWFADVPFVPRVTYVVTYVLLTYLSVPG